MCYFQVLPSLTHQQIEDLSLGMRLGSPSVISLVYNDQSRTSSAPVACISMQVHPV